jgi:tetratricopeptide (TPR) repeat protein
MPPDPATPEYVRELLLGFAESRRPEALDSAVDAAERILSAPGFDRLDRSASAMVWTLGAAARTWRARTPAARPDDLDRAIDWTAAAVQAWPPGDRKLPIAQVNLATALCDRFDDAGDAGDLKRAVPLFEAALPALQAAGERVDAARHSFAVCLHALSGLHSDPLPDLDRAIALLRQALADPAAEPGERAGYGNSLGLSLRRKALAVNDPGVLHEAEATYRAALTVAGPDGPVARAIAANLAIVLLDRADIDGDAAPLRDALQIYRDLLPTIDASLLDRITTNLAGVLVATYRFGRDRRLLDEAVTSLRASDERLPEGPRRQVARAALAGALHELFDHTGELAFLDEAITVQRAVIQQAAQRASRLLNLGISLMARFRRRRDPADLAEACRRFEEAAAAGGSAVETASFVVCASPNPAGSAHTADPVGVPPVRVVKGLPASAGASTAVCAVDPYPAEPQHDIVNRCTTGPLLGEARPDARQ